MVLSVQSMPGQQNLKQISLAMEDGIVQEAAEVAQILVGQREAVEADAVE